MLLALSAACSGGGPDWWRCGLLHLQTSPYVLIAARSGAGGGPSNGAVSLEDGAEGGSWLDGSWLGGGGEGGGRKPRKVQVERRGCELFCREQGGIDLPGTVQVTLALSNGFTSLLASARVPALSAGAVAVCRNDTTHPLLVDSAASVHLLVPGREEFRHKGVVMIGEKTAGRLSQLEFHPGAMGDSLCVHPPHATIELLTALLGRGDPQDLPAVGQSIPFDVCSCMKRTPSPGIPILISIERSGAPSMHNSSFPALHANKTIHAPPSNEIHGKGVAPPRSSELQDVHRRVLRQDGGQLRFARPEFTVNLPENIAIGSEVTTLVAVAPEGSNPVLSYSMNSVERTSNNLFAMESSTGVVRTTGRVQGGRGRGKERRRGFGWAQRREEKREEGGKSDYRGS